MDESDPYFFAYDQAIWYAKGRNVNPDIFDVTEECFALEYAQDCKLYHENKPNGYTDLNAYFDNYIKALDCFEDIVR